MNEQLITSDIQQYLDLVLLSDYVARADAQGLLTEEMKDRVDRLITKLEPTLDNVPKVQFDVVVDYLLTRNGV